MSRNDNYQPLPCLYSDEELDSLEEHIAEHYGSFEKIFQDLHPNDIRLDIAVIPPNTKNHFLTLVTMGLGAYKMDVPPELADRKLERAELVICLPPSWDLENEQPENMWPVQLLSRLAHLPVVKNTWLGWGHSVDYGVPFADNTELSAALLLGSAFGDESSVCSLDSGEEVNFYQVIPLYDVEMKYKIDHGAEALLDRFGNDLDPVVDIERNPAVNEDTFELIDRVEDHSCKIVEKQLDIFEINGANHIALFLRWCIENEMIDPEFTEFFADELEHIRNRKLDIRKFIINYLGGELTKEILSDEGKAFASYYYDFYAAENAPCYPADVDRVALDYFGEEKFNCEEFQDEAYLFVPYGEEYYVRICKYIDKNYRIFSGLK